MGTNERFANQLRCPENASHGDPLTASHRFTRGHHCDPHVTPPPQKIGTSYHQLQAGNGTGATRRLKQQLKRQDPDSRMSPLLRFPSFPGRALDGLGVLLIAAHICAVHGSLASPDCVSQGHAGNRSECSRRSVKSSPLRVVYLDKQYVTQNQVVISKMKELNQTYLFASTCQKQATAIPEWYSRIERVLLLTGTALLMVCAVSQFCS